MTGDTCFHAKATLYSICHIFNENYALSLIILWGKLKWIVLMISNCKLSSRNMAEFSTPILSWPNIIIFINFFRLNSHCCASVSNVKEYKEIIFGVLTCLLLVSTSLFTTELTRSNKCTFNLAKCNWRLTHASPCTSPTVTPDVFFHSWKLHWYIEYLLL